MAEPLTLVRSGFDAMPPNRPSDSDYHARLAVLEDGARRAERTERDLWQKLSEIRTLFDENMKASAEIITAAREVVKRVNDVVDRQTAFETHTTNVREASLQRESDSAKAIDTRMRAIEAAQHDGLVRRNTLFGVWTTAAGLIGAGISTLLHKFWP